MDHSQYQVVAARRLQWDNLVWQVPVLGLTAQAFLFTAALGEGDPWSRMIASLLSTTAAVLSITLMARHRQSELADSHWLAQYEAAHFAQSVHGLDFVVLRNREDLAAGRIGRFIPLLPGFKTWVIGLMAFGVAGAVAFVRAVAAL